MNNFRIRDFLGQFLRRHKWLVLLLSISVLGAALSGLLPPFMLRYVIDDYIAPRVEMGNRDIVGVLPVALLYFGSYFLVGLFTVFEDLMIHLFGQKMIHELRYAMIKKSHRLRTSYFTGHGSGEMESQVIDDVYSIETLLSLIHI